jgi:hypothetical protein
MGLAQKNNAGPKRRRSGEMLKLVVPPEPESGVRLSSSASADDVDDLRAVAIALMAAATGFDVCTRRAQNPDDARRMATLAEGAKRIADDVSAQVPGGVRRPTTSERLRWEWLASTAALLDGGAEGRVAEEAQRHIALAVTAAARLSDEALVGRIDRLATSSRAAAVANA